MSWQDDFVVVVNPTEEAVIWDSYEYRPGQRRTVPYLNMVNSFGEPRSVNGRHQIYKTSEGTGVIPAREEERRRVQVAWMIGVEGAAIQNWEELPALEFYDMDGNRLLTVKDDPQGNAVTPATPTVEDQQAMEAVIRKQQSQIEQLLTISGMDEDALPPSTPPPIADIPVDDSTVTVTQSPWAKAEEP